MNELRKDRVEAQLLKLNKTKGWLANQMNMSIQSLSRMLGGNNKPRIDNIIELSKILNVSIDYLLGLSNESSVDVSLKDISKKTGLSVKSIDKLQHFNSKDQKQLKALNLILENSDNLLSYLYDYLEIYPFGESWGDINEIGRMMSDNDQEKLALLELMESIELFKSHLKHEFDEQYRKTKINDLERRISTENLTEEQFKELESLINKLNKYDKDSII